MPGQRFFCCFRHKPLLQFTEGSNGFITEKTILFQGYRGGPTFSRGGGGPTFFQGVQMLIPEWTCDFLSRGSRPPIPPLDPHMSCLHKAQKKEIHLLYLHSLDKCILSAISHINCIATPYPDNRCLSNSRYLYQDKHDIANFGTFTRYGKLTWESAHT